jgi:predicted small lipoprotein YifL
MHCWARYLFYAVVTALAVGQMMVACGQTGPLYLPEQQSAASPAATPAAPPAATKSQPPRSPPSQPDAESLEAIDDIPDTDAAPVSPQAEGL